MLNPEPRKERKWTSCELIWAYEQRHHSIDAPDPIDLINSRMESGELTLDQLKEVLPNLRY